jgi:hypothetical protein
VVHSAVAFFDLEFAKIQNRQASSYVSKSKVDGNNNHGKPRMPRMNSDSGAEPDRGAKDDSVLSNPGFDLCRFRGFRGSCCFFDLEFLKIQKGRA